MQILILGATLNLISWIFAWGKFSPLSSYTFFPLWLGYILIMNGVSSWLFKRSLMSNLGIKFILLFLISIPFWWLFEALNAVIANWHYQGAEKTSPLIYFFGASISFSTVIPAVLSTSFLFYHILLKIRKFKLPNFQISWQILFASFGTGTLSLLLIFVFPQLTFGLLWLGVFLLLEPFNYILNFPSLSQKIAQGQWVVPISITLAALFTGFWWELWNYYSFPKWTYSVPYVGFFKVFEMPILGYLGYPFFGLEIYSFTSFALGILGKFLKNFNLDFS